jgi:hypothetical protein
MPDFWIYVRGVISHKTHIPCTAVNGSEVYLNVRRIVYCPIKVMIVSNTVVAKVACVSLELAEPTPGISPATGAGISPVLDVEPTVGTSPVTGELTPGMSPANAVAERTPTSVSANNNRFIGFVSFFSLRV